MAKLIVIEGSDGSGKTVQSALLHSYLQDNGVNSKILNFPDYESDTGKLVKSMLSGTFGKDPVTLNPYFTSSMYSIDRKQLWERIKSEKWFDDVDVFVIDICCRILFIKELESMIQMILISSIGG